ncbi:MAG TPA: photosynthetic reaction center cytochrome c subunit family protein [Pyrinomonadaceae bacterium]
MSKEHLRRGVVCAALALAASFGLWGRAARTSAQGPPAGDKPVEQTRKNIQVLKGLPESQLFPEMNFIAASLGVQCGFCHVSQGKNAQGQTNWVWESDEKEEKKVARDMMRMVLAVSGGNYGVSRGQDTCYTCHRGLEHPQNLPALPLAASGHEPPPAGAAPAPGAADAHGHDAPRPAQPTVQQVFDKYVAAVGAPAARDKFQTLVLKGTATASQNRTQNFEVTVKGTDKALLTVQGPQGGAMRRAVSGSTGWMSGPRGTRAFSPNEVAEARRNIDYFNVVKFAPSATMRVAGRRKVGERDAVVVVDRPSENVQRRYFFDAETGLLLRIVTLTDAVLNQIPEQVDFEDYRDVDGVKLPFVVRVSAIDTFNSRTQTVTEVKHGAPVEDTIFDMPKQQ